MLSTLCAAGGADSSDNNFLVVCRLDDDRLIVGFVMRAYREVTPFGGEYADRRDLYNLYLLLNHLNLFGGSYLYAVQRIAGRYA